MSLNLFVQYCASDVTMSHLTYDTVMPFSGTLEGHEQEAIAVMQKLVATSKQIQRSPLVLHMISRFLQDASSNSNFTAMAWCVKRLRTLQHNNKESAAIYHRAVMLIHDMLPLVSAFNTMSDIHNMLRNQHSEKILQSRVLNCFDKEMNAMAIQQEPLSALQLGLLNSIILFMHRCMAVVNGTLMFLHAGPETGALIDTLASNMILLHDKVSRSRDALFLTVMEGLCCHASSATVELLFQHFFKLFITGYATLGDIQIMYLQGVILRITRNSFALRRNGLMTSILVHDSLGAIAQCVHSCNGVTKNRHLSCMCVLSELLHLLPHTNMRSFELIMQSLIVLMDKSSDRTTNKIYLQLLQLIVSKRSERFSNDIAAELISVLTKDFTPNNDVQVLDIFDDLAVNHRLWLPVPSTQKIFLHALKAVIDTNTNIVVWVRCLNLVRIFIYQMSQSNLITVLEYSNIFIAMIETTYLRPRVISQVMFILRYTICRLLKHKDMICDRIHSLGVCTHVLAHLEGPLRVCSTDNRILEHAYIRTTDLLLVYDLIPRKHAVALAEHCARVLAAYKNNRKMVNDVLRVLLRTSVRYNIVKTTPFSVLSKIVQSVIQADRNEHMNVARLRLTLLQTMFLEMDSRCFCCSGTPCTRDQGVFGLCCDVVDYVKTCFFKFEDACHSAIRRNVDWIQLTSFLLFCIVEGNHCPYWEESFLKKLRITCADFVLALRVDETRNNYTAQKCIAQVRKLYTFANDYLLRVKTCH